MLINLRLSSAYGKTKFHLSEKRPPLPGDRFNEQGSFRKNRVSGREGRSKKTPPPKTPGAEQPHGEIRGEGTLCHPSPHPFPENWFYYTNPGPGVNRSPGKKTESIQSGGRPGKGFHRREKNFQKNITNLLKKC